MSSENMAHVEEPRIFTPHPATHAKYGFTAEEWREGMEKQDWKCGACRKRPVSGRLNYDHAHVRGWKKMPPEERKKYVRGWLCFMCNTHRLSRGATAENLRGAADYLEKYEARRAADG